MAIVRGLITEADARARLSASKDSWAHSSHSKGVSFFRRRMKPLVKLAKLTTIFVGSLPCLANTEDDEYFARETTEVLPPPSRGRLLYPLFKR